MPSSEKNESRQKIDPPLAFRLSLPYIPHSHQLQKMFNMFAADPEAEKVPNSLPMCYLFERHAKGPYAYPLTCDDTQGMS